MTAKRDEPVVCPACGNNNPALIDVRPDRYVCVAKLEDGDLCAFEWREQIHYQNRKPK